VHACMHVPFMVPCAPEMSSLHAIHTDMSCCCLQKMTLTCSMVQTSPPTGSPSPIWPKGAGVRTATG